MSKERELLRRALEALKDAKGEVADWGAYADAYFKKKWDYEGSITQYDPLIEELSAYLAAEPEAETLETLKAENFKLASGQCTEGGPWGDEGGTPYCKYKPEAKKPLTEEEIDEEISANDDYWLTDLGCFSAGVRFAERHHGIGGDDE